MPKTVRRNSTLEDLPNVGRAVAADFRRVGIRAPQDLRGRDPLDFQLHRRGDARSLRRKRGTPGEQQPRGHSRPPHPTSARGATTHPGRAAVALSNEIFCQILPERPVARVSISFTAPSTTGSLKCWTCNAAILLISESSSLQ